MCVLTFPLYCTLLSPLNFQHKRPEPIYAEPTKIVLPSSSKEDCEEVVLRQKPAESAKKSEGPKLSLYRNSAEGVDIDMPASTADEKRLSDSAVGGKDLSKLEEPRRRYHTKSLSLSENRLAMEAQNVFHQNRELWQKRATGRSTQSLTTPRILSRNRIAPDLVMDLPLSSAQIGASRESLDSEAGELTSAERFATTNQCTLKKNERFGDEKKEKPKAEVKPQEVIAKSPEVGKDDVRLHIEEGEKREPEKSPIPMHNTHKFASQFAGLHLTGGCKTDGSGGAGPSNQVQQLSSFKPQIKVKPQVMKKPLVLPPSTPEMSRRSNPE